MSSNNNKKNNKSSNNSGANNQVSTANNTYKNTNSQNSNTGTNNSAQQLEEGSSVNNNTPRNNANTTQTENNEINNQVPEEFLINEDENNYEDFNNNLNYQGNNQGKNQGNNQGNNTKNQNLEGEELQNAINKSIENQNKNKNEKNQAIVNGMFKSTANSVSSKVSDLTENISSNPTLMLVIKVVLGVILIIILINIVKYFYIKWDVSKSNSPLLIKGTKSAKQAMVISQDPNHMNYIPIKRSVDKEGIEFSYAFWFVITDFAYKNGEWKHMFHKGNSSSYPNRAPGVWIHPTNNIIRIYMNTMKNMLEFVDIDNIPLRKWVHMVITVKNRHLMIYVNGFLKLKKELSSIPRQNYGNVWANLYGGFEGFLSKLQYFSHAISSVEVDKLVTQGPGNGSCIDTNEVPPYLDDTWWLN